MNLAIFDFDGTLTKTDTLFNFLRFHSGTPKYLFYLCLLLPVFAAYGIGLLPNWMAKEFLMRFFIRGTPVDEFNASCQQFGTQVVPELVRPAALQKLMDHQNNQDRVVVISASAENWIIPWARLHGVEVIATRMQIVNGKITGKIEGKNCYGPEKVIRLKEVLKLEDYDIIYAYGDSKGDRELLSVSDVPNYKTFK